MLNGTFVLRLRAYSVVPAASVPAAQDNSSAPEELADWPVDVADLRESLLETEADFQANAQSAGTRSAPATACRDEPQTDPLGFLARGGRHSVRFTDELMSASMISATAPTRSVKRSPVASAR